MNKRIKQVRLDNDMNMTRFAEVLGVSQGTVSMWESGNRAISNQTIKLISREFNVSEEWLMTGEGSMYLPKTKAMIAADIADGYMYKNSVLKNEIIQIVSDMDENILRMLLKEAKRIVNAVEKAEKDQDYS